MAGETRERAFTLGLGVLLSLTLISGLGLLGRAAYGLALTTPTPAPGRPSPTRVVPTPTATPSPTGTPAPSPTVTPRPSPTATPAPSPCREGLLDGGFEAGEGWQIVLTAYSAGYVNKPAEYVTNPVRSGQHAMRLGITEGRNTYSYSAVDQAVQIPADADAATLSFWYLPVSVRSDDDVQYLLILKEGGGYDVLLWELRSAQDWQRLEFTLDAYRGKRVTLHFGVRNDGRGDMTAMYVDDVSLALCYGATPTPYASP
jgi:hypothetical protein